MIRKRLDILEDYLNGISVTEIAKKDNLTREAVYLHLRKERNWKKLKRQNAEMKLRKSTLNRMGILEEAFKLREQGISTSETARRLHVTPKRLSVLLQGTEYDNSARVRKERNKRICRDYKKGETQPQLAKKYGVSQSCISNVIREWGVSKRM